MAPDDVTVSSNERQEEAQVVSYLAAVPRVWLLFKQLDRLAVDPRGECFARKRTRKEGGWKKKEEYFC